MNEPKFLYGTAWKEEDTERCVTAALEAGFRAIDTANQRKHYHEAGVGNALRSTKIPRAELFLQTKFTFIDGQDHRLPYDPNVTPALQVQQSFQSSLEHLHTDYLDSYVLHGPSTAPGLGSADWEVWAAMEQLHRSGKVRTLGVSNVSYEQLKLLFEKAEIKPKFVQNRCYARTGWDHRVRKYCVENKITYQGFSLLTANPEVFKNLKFREIMRRTDYTPAQIVFCFARQIGMLPITGTKDSAHMNEDLTSLELALGAADLQALEAISL